MVCRSCRSSKRSCRTISAATGSWVITLPSRSATPAGTSADEVLLTTQHHRPEGRDEVESGRRTDLAVVDLVTDDVQVMVDRLSGDRRIGRSENRPQHAL